MGKPVKTRRHRGRTLILVTTVLILIALIYFAGTPLLRRAGEFLVINEVPQQADAIVVLAGGDPARPLEAAALYRANKAPYVVISTENPPRVFEQMKKDGVILYQTYENYLRVLQGYGVPEDRIARIVDPVGDTLQELTQVRNFAAERHWKSLIVVTSNFHTRRARLASNYLMEPDIHVTVVACHLDSFDPDSWWKSQADIRTFAIEVQKLASYGVFMWPRLLWRRLV